MEHPSFLLNEGGGGRTFQKLSHLWGGGGQNVLLERGNKPVKGAVDVEMGGLPIFYYFTVQSYLLCVCVCVCGGGRGREGEGVRFPLLLLGSSVF